MTIDPSNFAAQGKPTMEVAKAVWDQTREPSARVVAEKLTRVGYSISYRTVARWVKKGWTAEPGADEINRALKVEAARLAKGAEPQAEGLASTVIGGGMKDSDLDRIGARIKELAGKTKAELLEMQEKTRLVMNIVLMEEAAHKANVMTLIPKDTSSFIESFTEASKAVPAAPAIEAPGQPRNGFDAKLIEGKVVETSPLSQAIRAMREKAVA